MFESLCPFKLQIIFDFIYVYQRNERLNALPRNMRDDPYLELLASHEEMKEELKICQEVNDQNEKSLMIWKGVERELRKMDLESLHELETQMIGSLQSVRKVIREKSELENECRICRDRPKDTALFPCGHCLCSDCVLRVDKCPMCRVRIERTVKLR